MGHAVMGKSVMMRWSKCDSALTSKTRCCMCSDKYITNLINNQIIKVFKVASI